MIKDDNMTYINKDYIEEYIRELLPHDEDLRDMEIYAKENHVPIIQPEVAQFIRVLLRMKKPIDILEIGTAIGYSAIIMAGTSMSSNITSIERREDMIEIAKSNIKKKGLENTINIIQGEAEDVLSNLDKTYDFIFLDASKGHYKEFFDLSTELLKNGGIIVCDNVLFRGMVASDELVTRRKITIVKRLREFLQYINNIDGYTSSVIPIGDGVALIYKED